MRYQITLLEKGQEPLSVALEVNYAEGKTLGNENQVLISVGDVCGEGSTRLPLNILSMLMSKVMAAADSREKIVLPDTGLIGLNGEKLS